MKNEEQRPKRCRECLWFPEKDYEDKYTILHYWWCPAQTDAELLRKLVEKVREMYERFQNF